MAPEFLPGRAVGRLPPVVGVGGRGERVAAQQIGAGRREERRARTDGRARPAGPAVQRSSGSGPNVHAPASTAQGTAPSTATVGSIKDL